MDNKIKVSIIIPIYNCEKYINRCLKSVVNQTLKEIEIICVNDGTKDKSVDIVNNFINQDKRIILINQENQGISCARNNGIKKAQGEFLAFVDSDDYIDENFCEVLYNAAIKYNADISTSGIIREGINKKTILLSFDKEIYTEDIKMKYILTKVPKCCFVWNKLYRRKAIIQNNLFFPEGLVYEDMMFTPDVYETLGGLVVVNNTNYHYWKNKSSTIKQGPDKFRADKLITNSYLSKKIDKHNLEYAKKWRLVKKYEYRFLGIKILKVYQYRATKKYYLFGIFPFFEKKEYI